MGENNLSFKSVFPGQSRMQTKLSGIFADLTPDTQRQDEEGARVMALESW